MVMKVLRKWNFKVVMESDQFHDVKDWLPTEPEKIITESYWYKKVFTMTKL